MPRVRNIKNEWGVQGGPNPQRSDLWQADLENVIRNLNRSDPYHPDLQILPRYVPCAVSLPSMKVKPEVYWRDSRPYQMPSMDEPLDGVRISFIMDDGKNVAQSEVYRVLDSWRRLVRAGRGALGSERFLVLDQDYTLAFRFPIYLYLCRGHGPAPPASTVATESRFARPNTTTQNATFDATSALAPSAIQTRRLVEREEAFRQQLTAGLELTNIFMLENAWLADFKISDMSYDQAKVLTIDGTFFAENILQFEQGSQAPITL